MNFDLISDEITDPQKALLRIKQSSNSTSNCVPAKHKEPETDEF